MAPKRRPRTPPTSTSQAPAPPPHFVRTLESSANAPLPPSVHTFLYSFGTFTNIAGTAIDHSNGDVYVMDIHQDFGSADVLKFDFAGHTDQQLW